MRMKKMNLMNLIIILNILKAEIKVLLLIFFMDFLNQLCYAQILNVKMLVKVMILLILLVYLLLKKVKF